MPSHLKKEVSVSPLVEKFSRPWPLDRQSTEDERPGGEAQILAGAFALGSDEFNDFSLAHLLLRDEEICTGVPQYASTVFQAVFLLYSSRTKM